MGIVTAHRKTTDAAPARRPKNSEERYMKRPVFSLKPLLSGLGALALATGAMADGHVKELLWEREGADFSGFQQVYLLPLNLDDVQVL